MSQKNLNRHRPININLDALRGICLSLVLATHFFGTSRLPIDSLNLNSIWRNFWILGSFGVTGFFVLSAYLLTSNFLNDASFTTKSVNQYYARRALRILPLYYLILSVEICYTAVSGKLSFGNLHHLLIFTANQEAYKWDDPGILGHLWSICVEVQFYILLPLLIMVKTKTRIFLVIIAILISVISRFVISTTYPYPAVWNFTSSHLGAFGLGIGIAYFSRSKSQLINSRRLWIFLLLNLVALFIEAITLGSKIFSGQISSVTYLQAELIFACVILLVLKSKSILFPKFLLFLGKRSYGIYIYHWPILLIFKDQMGITYLSLIQVVGLLSFTFLVGAFSYKFIERPFLNMKPYPREGTTSR